MANAENINKVIASIKGEIEATKKLGFNMSYPIQNDRMDRSGRGCGTIACIAGHAYVNTLDVKRGTIVKLAYTFEWGKLFKVAQDELGLTYEEREKLFFAVDPDSEEELADLDEITPEQAIRTLEHLRDTGEVSWKV